MHVQKKVIKVLKNTDFTLVKHISALHRNILVSDNKTKEIYSSLNSAEHYYNSKSVAVSDILSNSYTMPPLLEHIYESIESGMYLYKCQNSLQTDKFSVESISGTESGAKPQLFTAYQTRQ